MLRKANLAFHIVLGVVWSMAIRMGIEGEIAETVLAAEVSQVDITDAEIALSITSISKLGTDRTPTFKPMYRPILGLSS